ncbi:unnamed protein product [Brugia timori]|uniref:Uncharacterized protein n=1 Tax=Brugia timori TaxID=42155 RepID=A0A0R3R0B5_9BILA|nr:unnamed protein product [Brugia timori]
MYTNVYNDIINMETYRKYQKYDNTISIVKTIRINKKRKKDN